MKGNAAFLSGGLLTSVAAFKATTTVRPPLFLTIMGVYRNRVNYDANQSLFSDTMTVKKVPAVAAPVPAFSPGR